LHLLQRWEGEQEWFPGQIEGWDPVGSTYTVSLQPSCTCSFAAVILESSLWLLQWFFSASIVCTVCSSLIYSQTIALNASVFQASNVKPRLHSGSSGCHGLSHLTVRLQVQYADGDMEQGLSFVRYEVYKDSSNTQLVKVHDYKAGKYVAQATQPDGDDAVPIDSAAQSAQDNAAPTDTAAWSAEEFEPPAVTAAVSAGGHAVPKHETGQADLAEDDAVEVADLGSNSQAQGMVDANPFLCRQAC